MFKLGKMVMQFQFVSQQLRFFLKTKCPYSQAHTFKTKTKNIRVTGLQRKTIKYAFWFKLKFIYF